MYPELKSVTILLHNERACCRPCLNTVVQISIVNANLLVGSIPLQAIEFKVYYTCHLVRCWIVRLVL